MDQQSDCFTTSVSFSLRVGKHRAIPNQRPQRTGSSQLSYVLQQQHASNINVSTTQFKISRTHLTTQALKQTPTANVLHSLRRKTDERFQVPLCLFVCVCARTLVVIVCYWVSLAVCFHSHSQSFPTLLPSRLIFLTLAVLCNSCKTLSAPRNHFMHFLLPFCHSAVFKILVYIGH